jgi:hypothetical protein
VVDRVGVERGLRAGKFSEGGHKSPDLRAEAQQPTEIRDVAFEIRDGRDDVG